MYIYVLKVARRHIPRSFVDLTRPSTNHIQQRPTFRFLMCIQLKQQTANNIGNTTNKDCNPLVLFNSEN